MFEYQSTKIERSAFFWTPGIGPTAYRRTKPMKTLTSFISNNWHGDDGGLQGGISSSVLSVFFTDKFALSQSDARISVAYNSCQ